MIDVVGDGDIFPEQRLSEAPGEARALIVDGSGGKIVEEEADEIEDGGWFQNENSAWVWR